jgi:hypothetical protein
MILRIASGLLGFLLVIHFLSCTETTGPPPSGPDTTSHNFTWTVSTLGDGGHCLLREVVIAEDSVAFATGKVNLWDTLGGGTVVTFNFLRWNGATWRGGRIDFFTVCGQRDRYAYPAKSCLAFGPGDLWISMDGSQIAKWDGTQQTVTTCYPVVGGTLWGARPTFVYSVGDNDDIAFFNGSNWQGFSGGAGTPLTDVHGSPSGSHVWACGFSEVQAGTHLLRVEGTTASIAFDGTAFEHVIRDDSLSGALTSVFAPSDDRLFVASNAGVYEVSPFAPLKGKRIALDDNWFPGFPRRIRGNAANDWFVVGSFGFVAHYNGSTLHHYPELMKDTYVLYSVAQRGDLVIAVGYDYDPFDSKALIMIGRRI